MTQKSYELSRKHGGVWGAHPAHPAEDWQYEVQCDYTRLGYWEWAYERIQQEREE